VRIFVSYRRSDAAAHAGRLSDGLARRFGAHNVFHDVTAIAPGQNFEQAIDRALVDCDAVLVVIGPGWLTASTPQGTPRLLDPDDRVRLEVVTALRRDVRVVPVLVGAATLPAAADLPHDLHGLRSRQAVVLHDATWVRDVDALVAALPGGTPAPTSRRRWVLAATAAVVVLLIAGALTWWRPGTSDDPESAELLRCDPPPARAGHRSRSARTRPLRPHARTARSSTQ